MFRKLKIRIGILMSAISFMVLFLVVSALAGVTYYSSISQIRSKLEVVVQLVDTRIANQEENSAQDSTPVTLDNIVEETAAPEEGSATSVGDSTSTTEPVPPGEPGEGRLFPELDYFYFQISLEDNTVLNRIMGNNSIDTERANIYIREALNRTDEFGQIEVTYYKKVTYDTYVDIYFVDATTEVNNRKTVLLHSIIIGGSSFILLTALGFAFSGVFIKPYERMYANEKTFLTNASHELKTPLSIMSLNNELMKKKHPEDEETVVMGEQIHRMGSLINEMVTLNKVNEMNAKVVKETTDLTEIVYECLDQFEPIYENNGITVVKNIDEDVLSNLNQESIYKLMSIIFENATKYTSANGKIEISLIKENKFVTFLMRNSTTGLDREGIKHVFDRFYTMDESHSVQSSGYGIGLSIAKKIAEINVATITAYADEEEFFNIKVVFKALPNNKNS